MAILEDYGNSGDTWRSWQYDDTWRSWQWWWWLKIMAIWRYTKSFLSHCVRKFRYKWRSCSIPLQLQLLQAAFGTNLGKFSASNVFTSHDLQLVFNVFWYLQSLILGCKYLPFFKYSEYSTDLSKLLRSHSFWVTVSNLATTCTNLLSGNKWKERNWSPLPHFFQNFTCFWVCFFGGGGNVNTNVRSIFTIPLSDGFSLI